MASDKDYLLTRKEVSDIFGISKRYLELAVSRTSGPPFVKIGRSLKYRMQDIRDWIDQNTVRTSS